MFDSGERGSGSNQSNNQSDQRDTGKIGEFSDEKKNEKVIEKKVGLPRGIFTREEEEAAGILFKRRILVIEDDSPGRAMIRMALETEGYDVLEATTGFRLIVCLQVEHPDLVFLSEDLKWTRSEDLCRVIKTSPDLRDIPVVFMTMEQEDETLARLAAAGGDGWIPKPVDLDDLLRFVRKLVGPAKGDRNVGNRWRNGRKRGGAKVRTTTSSKIPGG